MKKSHVLIASVVVVALVATLALSALGWMHSEMEASFAEEVDATLSAVTRLRASAGPAATQDPEVLRAIEEHESGLDVFALTLAELQRDSSGDVKAALARIRNYRQKYPRATSQHELDVLVQKALSLEQ